MIYGSVVVHDAVIAFSTGKLVSLGGRGHGIDLPPLLAGPIGVFALLVGLWLLTNLIVRRK